MISVFQRVSCSLLFSLLMMTHVQAESSCTGTTNPQACEGPYGLTWSPYSAFDDGSGHYHVIALTDIAAAFSKEPVGYRVPTIKELITIMGLDGTSYPTVDSWLINNGYLISSTSGSGSGGFNNIMAIDAVTKAVVELPMIGSGGELYYLIAVK